MFLTENKFIVIVILYTFFLYLRFIIYHILFIIKYNLLYEEAFHVTFHELK